MTHEIAEIRSSLVKLSLSLYEPRSLGKFTSGWQEYEPDKWQPREARIRADELVTRVLHTWSTSDQSVSHPPLPGVGQVVSVSRKDAAVNLTRGVRAGHIFMAVFLGYGGLPHKVSLVERLPDPHLQAFGGSLLFVMFPHAPPEEYHIEVIESALAQAASLDRYLEQEKIQRGFVLPPEQGFVQAFRLPSKLPSYVSGPSSVHRAKHALD